ncbi:MAG TPA: hypothetical protein VNU95_11530, partial [Candidatus Acidoferrales bacterium]|nr:hypothetical protein [Candidatus Acidoferrales bacterium]
MSGCAHDATSRPVASATAAGTVTNVYTFPVTYTGTAPLSYQWHFINTNIQPKTNNTVTITGTVTNAGTPPSSNTNGNWYLDITTNTNGNWYLEVTNDSGVAA